MDGEKTKAEIIQEAVATMRARQSADHSYMTRIASEGKEKTWGNYETVITLFKKLQYEIETGETNAWFDWSD